MSFDEGGHWYLRDGTPCYEVPRSGGGMRPFNLRWDRGLKAVPSVTTVTSVMAKPALTSWMVKQGVWAALTGTRRDGEDDDTYIDRILAESRQQAIDAADEGSRIHDACEQLVKSGACPEQYRIHAEAAVAELHRLFPNVNDWVAEKCFSHPMGFGGKCDLHSPSTGIIVDWKTKDGDFSDGKRLNYDQHIQLAAYQVGLGICKCTDWHEGDTAFMRREYEHVPCANIFVSRTHPGKVASHVWSADDVASGWRIFEKSLALWIECKGYDPSF